MKLSIRAIREESNIYYVRFSRIEHYSSVHDLICLSKNKVYKVEEVAALAASLKQSPLSRPG